jgi:multimeric flavodoxin WrbA
MKVLGLSLGRKMKNSELLVKEALMGAEEAGANVAFLRCIDLKVNHCIGCGACSAMLGKGKEPRCVQKDDYQTIEDAVMDADAVIVSAPVYVLGPVGQVKNFVDRFGPMHDMAEIAVEQRRRKNENLPPLDERFTRRRYVAYISQGGAVTPHWVSLGMPCMHLFGFSALMKPVDALDLHDMGRRGSPVLDEALMARARSLGENLARAALAGADSPEWKGEPGTCPVCHCDILTINHRDTKVECPICGISGELSVVDGKIRVDFPAEQRRRSRYTMAGLMEHHEELLGIKSAVIPKIKSQAGLISERLKKYEGYLG